MIPEGKLYSDKKRNPGEIASHHPEVFTDSHVAEGDVPFGRVVVKGSETGKAKIINSAADKVLGICAFSFEASALSLLKHLTGDPMGAVRQGIVIAEVEESVLAGDPVRVRLAEDSTAGYQEWGFSEAVTGASASGLANDTTKYGAIIVVDKVAKEINIVGSAAQTLATVISGINTDLGSVAVAALVDGKLRITSASKGANSEISITDGNDFAAAGIFATLTNANAEPEDAVPGLADESETLEPGKLCKTAVTGQTAVLSNAEFVSDSADGLVELFLKGGSYTLTAD
jgi:hypothetical protein